MALLRPHRFSPSLSACLPFLFGLWWQHAVSSSSRRRDEKRTFFFPNSSTRISESSPHVMSLIGRLPISLARQMQCSDWPPRIKSPPPGEAGVRFCTSQSLRIGDEGRRPFPQKNLKTICVLGRVGGGGGKGGKRYVKARMSNREGF